MLGISVAASAASTNWHKIQTWFARRSNLGIRGEKDDRRHVVVTNDFVAIEGPEGYEAKLPFSDLRRVDADDSICLAYFGHGSYAYFPRPAMSTWATSETVGPTVSDDTRLAKDAHDFWLCLTCGEHGSRR